MIFDLNDCRVFLLIGVFIVMIGTIIACTTKKQCGDIEKIFFSLLVMICGFTLIGFAFSISVTESKINEAKQEIFQIIYEQKYNVDDTIQCLKDTFSLQ